MPLIIQKYGGSSLADSDAVLRVANRISRSRSDGNHIVAVVSAMGDSTNNLINLAHQISDPPDPRELDVLQSTGELTSCALVAMALKSLGQDSISLSGAQAGIHTDTSFGNARIDSLNPSRILKELGRDRIVIVAGFQGITRGLDVTTLGRGASDLTAVAIAAELQADRCEVYTDVEGIYTADPNLVPEARRLDEIGFENMLEMASYGAKMNPRSIEMAMVYDVPILVASSFIDGPGTLIHGGVNMCNKVGEIRDRVVGIATDTNVANITVLHLDDQPGVAARLFEPLASADISVDVIVQNSSVDGTTNLTFTVKLTDLCRALDVVRPAANELGSGGVTSARGLAKLSIVGTGMQDVPGYAAKMFSALAEAGVNIEMITTSEIRITCIVSESNIEKGVRALHSAFGLER